MDPNGTLQPSPVPTFDPFINPPSNDLLPLEILNPGLEHPWNFGTHPASVFNSPQGSQPAPGMSMGFGTPSSSPFNSQPAPGMSVGFGIPSSSPFSGSQPLPTTSMGFGTPSSSQFNSQPAPGMSVRFGTPSSSPFNSQPAPGMSVGFGTPSSSPFSSQPAPGMSVGFGTPSSSPFNSQSSQPAQIFPFGQGSAFNSSQPLHTTSTGHGTLPLTDLLSSSQTLPMVFSGQEGVGLVTIDGQFPCPVSQPFQSQGMVTFEGGIQGQLFAEHLTYFNMDTSQGPTPHRLQMARESLQSTGFRITTGSRNLDSLLGGGIQLGALTGITGGTGSGISELCQMLCITTQLPVSFGGVDGGVIFLDMERNFQSSTLLPLAERYGIPGREALNRIKYATTFNLDQLNGFVNHEVPNLLSQSKCGLIIINGLLSCYRFGKEWVYDFETLCRTIKSLKETATQRGVAVVVSTGYPGARTIPNGGQALTDQFSIWTDLNNCEQNVKSAKLNGGNSVAFFKITPSGITDVP